MKPSRLQRQTVHAEVGFAADAAGRGVAYVRMSGRRTLLVRVPFSVKRYPALLEREVGYAALTAAAGVLRKHGVQHVRLAIEDPRLANDVSEHRDVPAALALSYVRLGCSLNQFASYEICAGDGASELTSRARSDVALHAAA